MKMFPHPQPAPELPLIDNSFAPELMVTGVSGMGLLNGVVAVTLESLRCDHSKTPPPLERLVVARLALPVASAQNLLLSLQHFLGQHGLDPLPLAQETRQ
ncbi:hypothetical protein FHS31_002722 [Sphingomonas vulcanisoli]|uniref:LysR substrate-binding domain-containing protein n=1 Tax=Sphingomonas vulcanisoli TaxID=1658060 RepID=A0ABX0TXH0_9SPHN|nr:hypothetical protein [Sphingomonas vulcanisoli]NIJ09090.1 hypothetical protein [Sphingomonas vulcanisoli]